MKTAYIMNRLLILFALSFIFSSSYAFMPMDSLGTVSKDGMVYIQHKVERGETLYALSRKYERAVDDIKRSNGNSTALEIGQVVLIPFKKSSVSSSGKTHTVQNGETLYSISRETGVSVSEIKKLNNLSDNEISVGQKLLLSQGNASVGNAYSAGNGSNSTHTVQKGETLYSISRSYNIPVGELRSLNNMSGNEISVGQTLRLSKNASDNIKKVIESPSKTATSSPSQAEKHTVQKGETLFSVSQKYGVEVNDLIKANNLTSSSLNSGQVLLIPVAGIATVDPEKIEKKEVPVYKTVNKPTKTPDTEYFSKKRYERISEDGTANSWNGGSLESKYSYCLHKNAPIGTVVKITNKKNEQFVYARVIGNDVQGTNLITVNNTVQNRLETKKDEVFNVSISYVK